MTESEYRQHPAVSRSDLWAFHRSPEKFRYFQEHPEPPSAALTFGRVVHKVVLEPETFGEEFAVWPSDADRRTKAGREAWEEFRAAVNGVEIISSDIHKQALAIRESLERVPIVRKLLTGDHERPFFWTDEVSGEDCKCRVDCLCMELQQPVIVDVKTTTDASTEAFQKDAIKYGYDLQAAFYSAGVAAELGVEPLFAFVVVEKAEPYAVNVFLTDDVFKQRGRKLMADYLAEYAYCRKSGDWYGYLGKEKLVNNLSLPTWLARELE